jgi:hypothetical protein
MDPDVQEPSVKSGPRLVDLDATAAEEWDQFAAQHPDATAYHLSAWGEILNSAYRLKPVYLGLEGVDGEIRGILPLVYGRGAISGTRVTSLPGKIQLAGPLGLSTEDEVELLDAACEFVRSGEARLLHIRSRKEGYDRTLPGLTVSPAWPSWRIQLPPEVDAFWERFTGRLGNLRRDVKKAQRLGVSVREGGPDDLRRFYHLYLKTARRHRELPRTMRQFTVSQRLLGPRGVFKLMVAEYDGRVVAGGVFHFFRDTVEVLCNSSDDRYLHLRPNHALYSQVIGSAITRGFQSFDFGVAQPGSSLADFKRRWTAEPVPRFHYNYPGPEAGTGTPVRTRRAMRIRARLRAGGDRVLARVWERAPLAFTRLGGVVVYRYL